ncbi:MAG TPA: hypothetical protein VND98_07000 [Solirubrobacterales bacterium]|nr:hypothetical protein [Solirubrobacterales bacterium]
MKGAPPDRSAPSKGQRSVLTVGVSMLAALALGLLLGRATAPSTELRAALPANAGAARTQAGVPMAFPHTPAGAAEAVASYQRAFATPAILRAGVLRARIEAVAAPDYVRTMLAANTPGEQRIAAGPIGQGARAGLQTIYAAVPIGYRIESYSRARARVLTWGFTLLGNASAVEPAAYFGLTHTELIWTQGEWKIAETRAGFGPTPKLATPPGPLGGYGVIGLARGLRSYELAP